MSNFLLNPGFLAPDSALCILSGDRLSCEQEFSASGILQPESYASGLSLASCYGIQEIYLPETFPFFPMVFSQLENQLQQIFELELLWMFVKPLVSESLVKNNPSTTFSSRIH